MARTEPFYRRDNERFESAAVGRLVDPVSRRTERDCGDIANGHCQTFTTTAADGQHDYRRTRKTGTYPDDASRRAESGNVQVSSSEHHSTRLNVSANADIVVSANDRFTGQQMLTYPRRDPEEAIRILGECRYPRSVCPNPEPNGQTPGGGRSESQHKKPIQCFRFGWGRVHKKWSCADNTRQQTYAAHSSLSVSACSSTSLTAASCRSGG